MKLNTQKSFLKRCAKRTWRILRFFIIFFGKILAENNAQEKHEPTIEELWYGHKLYLSDKYVIPPRKHS